MKDRDIPSKQLWAWIAVAVSASLAHHSGAGWFAVLLAAGAMLPLTVLSAGGWRAISKIEALAEFIWIGVALAALISQSGDYWPGSSTEWVVPLVLLVLAALSGGGERSAKIGAVLNWVMMLLSIPVLFMGVAQGKVEYLKPVAGEWTAGLLLTLLIPGLSGIWSEEGSGRVAQTVGLGALAVLLAALAQGILSPKVSVAIQAPFFEVSRGVGRLEPVVAAALTFGWYQLACFLMSSASELGTRFGLKEPVGRWIICVAAGGLVFFCVQLDGGILTVLGLFFWVLIPMLHTKKISKKNEKRC